MREFSSDLWELRKLVTQMLASEDKPTYYVQYWQSRGEGSKNLPHSPRSCSRKSLSTAVSFRGRQRNEAELSAVNGEALFGSLVAGGACEWRSSFWLFGCRHGQADAE